MGVGDLQQHLGGGHLLGQQDSSLGRLEQYIAGFTLRMPGQQLSCFCLGEQHESWGPAQEQQQGFGEHGRGQHFGVIQRISHVQGSLQSLLHFGGLGHLFAGLTFLILIRAFGFLGQQLQ